MKRKLEVDRFEGDIVVLLDEEEKIYNIPAANFPFPVHEGESLLLDLDGETVLSAEYLREETEARRSFARALMEKLRRKTEDNK